MSYYPALYPVLHFILTNTALGMKNKISQGAYQKTSTESTGSESISEREYTLFCDKDLPGKWTIKE